MERFRWKKSRSSNHQLAAPTSDTREGGIQAKNNGNLSKLTSDSSCCTIPTTSGEQLFSPLDFGISNSQRVSGMPMKKLMADELSKEGVVKRRSPGIIARLMGLDGLPVPQPVHNHRKEITHSHESSVKPQSDFSFKESHHHQRKKSMDHQEFKDVYEVVDTVSREAPIRQCHPRTERVKCSPDEMEFKFMEAKSLSSNEKFQNSKEFHSAPDILDSKNNLLLKYLEEPDSLFSKHFQDTRSCLPKQNATHVKSLNRTKIEKSMVKMSTEDQRIRKHERRSLRMQGDSPPLVHTHGFRCDDASGSRRSKVRSQQKDQRTHVSPTRIVILKPNTEKSQNSIMPSLHQFPADRGRLFESPGIRYMEMGMLGKEGLSKDSSISGCRAKGSREIAREITRKMRTDLTNYGSFSPAYARGYVVEDNPHNISECDSESELDAATAVVAGRKSFDFQSQHQLFSGRSTVMAVSPESKRRLSEMWRMTHTFHETRELERISTLGEILATSEEKIQAERLDYCIERESGRRGMGENSWNRQKNANGYATPDSKFPEPSPSTSHEIQKRSSKPEFAGEQWRFTKHENKDRFNGALNVGDGKNLSHQGTIYGCNKIEPTVYLNKQTDRTVLSPGGRNRSPSLDNNWFGDDDRVLIKHDSTIEIDNSITDNMNTSSGVAEDVLEDTSIKMVEPSSTEPSEDTQNSPHSPSNAPEPESPASLKEADQPSPISTLETPFVEDMSTSSECFGKVSAELEGLRKQLNLLKLESEEYDEGSIIVSSDEEEEEEERETLGSEEDWLSCYMADVLSMVDWGEPPDRDMYGPPLGLSVYEKLEKKYQRRGGGGSWCERKLLFDHVNHRVLDHYGETVDRHPWVGGGGGKRRCRDGRKLEEELRRLVRSGGGGGGGEGGAVTFEEWTEVGEDKDGVGGEVGRMLMDELLIEVVAELA